MQAVQAHRIRKEKNPSSDLWLPNFIPSCPSLPEELAAPNAEAR